MKKTILVIIMTLASLSLAVGDGVTSYTGYDWVEWDESMKIMYTLGYMSGMADVWELTNWVYEDGLISKETAELYFIETECQVTVKWLYTQISDSYNRNRNWDDRIVDVAFTVLGKMDMLGEYIEYLTEEAKPKISDDL